MLGKIRNLSWYAVTLVCVGIFLIGGGTVSFLISPDHFSEGVLFGFALLSYGLANNGEDKSPTGNIFTNLGRAALVLGGILLIYNTVSEWNNF